MTVCGIIAEYNPFHLGHAWHLRETRRRLGGSAVLVCAMSGNFVQRGDFALLDQYERAAAAVECGADLAVALPLPAALSSADGFARGGMRLLAALGCGWVSFGAECGDPARLERAARLAASPQLAPRLADALRAGQSYAAALQTAAAEFDPEAAALFSAPNNTLGIAYCAQAEALGIRPLPIPRIGAGHDAPTAKDGFASASFLRGLLGAAPPETAADDSAPEDWRRYLPEASARRLEAALREGRAPMLAAACDTALLAHLRRLDVPALRAYAPGLAGFAERLHRAVQEGRTFPEVCAAAQTRRYTLANVRRTLLRAYLELPADLSPDPQYIRVLALNARGAEVLRHARLPVLTKPAAERRLPEALQPALRRDALADSLYALAAPEPSQRSAQARWRKTPFVLK